MLFKLTEKLVTLWVSETDTSNVINVLKTEDLLRACNTKLKTDQKIDVFKNSFYYVEPVQICLGHNEAGKSCFSQYVPIKQTIESLFHCESVREQYKQVLVLRIILRTCGMAEILQRMFSSIELAPIPGWV